MTTVRLIRHGETSSYAADSGLTPRGVAQAFDRGVALADAVGSGTARLVAARSHRARETAEHLGRGLADRLSGIGEPEPAAEFDNFAVATPTGRREPTAAYAEYAAAQERHAREGTGPAPGWVLETERFWGAHEADGNPILFWLTVPLLHFEPPAVCVRRFWTGIGRVARLAEHVIVATHSGPMRAVATAALGHDLGEPRNAEEVVVYVDGEVATVAYRGEAQEVRVPDVASLPAW